MRSSNCFRRCMN